MSMATRRAFLFNSLANLATFAASGSLVTVGKGRVNEVIHNYNQEVPPHPTNVQKKSEEPQKQGLENPAIDFTLGGGLGVAIKKVVEKSIKLKRVNKELSSIVSRLQQLKDNDLAGMKEILQRFVNEEGIRYEANKDNDLIGSIRGLLDAILIHVTSQKKAVQPFLQELQELRKAIAPPFIKQLENGDTNAVIQQAGIEALRSGKLTEYLGTIVINALESDGAGKRIGKNIADSLEKRNLVSDDGVVALRQILIDIFKSKPFVTALTEASSIAVGEYGVADKLVDALVERFLDIRIREDDTNLVALKDALKKALESDNVAEALAEAICNYVSESDTAKDTVKALVQKVKTTGDEGLH